MLPLVTLYKKKNHVNLESTTSPQADGDSDNVSKTLQKQILCFFCQRNSL